MLFTEMFKKECYLEARVNSCLPVTTPNVTEAEWPFYEQRRMGSAFNTRTFETKTVETIASLPLSQSFSMEN